MDHACHTPLATNIGSPYLQITSLGLIWVFLHCAPMCGPIVSGLNLNKELHPLSAIALYQLGRSIIYGLAGACAGYIGASFHFSSYWGWLLSAVLGLMFFYQAFPNLIPQSQKIPSILYKISNGASKFSGWKRPFIFGILFAFLPCMLTAWALTLAATTNSPLHGAAIMLILILMTTLPLLGVSWGFSKIFRSKQKKISILLLGISFVCTTLVTAAANNLIPHQHIEFKFQGKAYQLMFW